MSATSDKAFEEIPKKYINPLIEKDKSEGRRVSAKEWKVAKDAYRVKSVGVRMLNTWKLREEKKLLEQQLKQRLKDLKEEKAEEQARRLEAIKKRREAIEEKKRYEQIAVKMHAKKVERLRKKEKRNKMLRER